MDTVIQRITDFLLAGYGGAGLGIAFVLVLYWQERTERKESQEARLKDLGKIMEQSSATTMALDKSADRFEALRNEIIAARRK